MYGGTLNPSKFGHLCYLCKKTDGQCVKCDLTSCGREFHVRCAMRKGLIKSMEQMDAELRLGDWECKVFCEKHS